MLPLQLRQHRRQPQPLEQGLLSSLIGHPLARLRVVLLYPLKEQLQLQLHRERGVEVHLLRSLPARKLRRTTHVRQLVLLRL